MLLMILCIYENIFQTYSIGEIGWWIELSDSENFYELSDSENFTITIVKIVLFTIMNTITIVDLLNISTHNTNGFLKFYELSQFQAAFYIISGNFC